MTTTETLLSLSPDDIIVKENIRFNLKPYSIDHLAEEIASAGGVNTPIEVQDTPEGYVLTCGHRRLEAVKKLNAQGAGLTIPARVMPLESDAARTLRQVSENNERENLSPMDKAIAMQKLLSQGLSKMDVRKAFATAGGRKGLKFAPASNSFVNMTLSFLDLPKPVQNKIHDGLIPVGEAYELTKIPVDKRQQVLERIEAERIRDIDKADNDEAKLLKSEKDLSAKTEAAEILAAEHAKVAEVTKSAQQIVEEKEKELSEAFTAQVQARKTGDTATKKAADERFKSATNEVKSANEAASKAAKELTKLSDKVETAAERAQAAKDRLEAARKAKLAKKGTDPAKDAGKMKSGAVKKAAAKEGASDKPIKLNVAEQRDAIKTLILNGKPITKAIGSLIIECFDGKITDGQLEMGVGRACGEIPMAKGLPVKGK